MTVIKNGIIVDGTGTPSYDGDVVVDGDRIVDVIRNWSDEGLNRLYPDAELIDATGRLVTPGFVDAHSHSDAYLVIEPNAPSKITQGITTEVNGQCGGSVAPRYGEARLSSDWAALLGERLTWRSIAEYREVLAAARPALNTVQFIGHNTLRSSVVGYAGRAATSEELSMMRRLLEQAIDEGGWGLTTGLIYQPGKYSTPQEVVELAKTTAKRGGLYATHMRSEGDSILEAIDEVLDLVRTTGIRAEVSHLKTSGRRNWHKIDAILDKMQCAIDSGLLLGSDRYPYCAAGTDLDVVLPDWAQEGAAKTECVRLSDAVTRRRIIGELNALDRDWSTVMVGGTWHEENKRFSGRSISDIQREHSLSPGEVVCGILDKDLCRTGAFFFGMSEENLDKIYRCAWIVPGSDASLRAPWGVLGADHPHPRAYATMPEFYRRVRALGYSREEAVARMTSIPARRFGLNGRGIIEKGAFADIAVWREDAFAAKSTYVEPHQFSDGVDLVMVNGSVPYRDGCFTGNRDGRFLEK